MVARLSTAGTVASSDAVDVRVIPSLGVLVPALESGCLAAAAVDIPIGLPETGPRDCDRLARRMLGPRRSSVFPAPARAVLQATSYAQACALSREICGKGLSKQLYNIVDKIRDADDVVSPRLQPKLFEACPELSFALMHGGEPMPHTKRTQEGRAERLAALRVGLGTDVTPLVDRPPAGAARDDVLDALALAWTARRAAAGDGLRLGGDTDGRGLRMEVLA